MLHPFVCPRCLKISNQGPALSKRDNKTDICNDCGETEALLDFIIDRSKQRGDSTMFIASMRMSMLIEDFIELERSWLKRVNF